MSRRALLLSAAGVGVPMLLGVAACGGSDDRRDEPTQTATDGLRPEPSSTNTAASIGSPIWLPTTVIEPNTVAPDTATRAGSATATARQISTPGPAPIVIDASTPSPTPTPEPPADRLVIPSIGVQAKVEVKGLTGDRQMQIPDNPYNVAWYDFTPWPGHPGNSVFAGHVDDINVGRAVFFNLRDLGIGADVRFDLLDGRSIAYRVVRTFTLSANDPADAAILPTGVDTLTMITCTGNYVASGQKYDARLIVQAERVTA